MTIFAIIAPGRSDVLKAAVERVFPDKNFEFAPGQFVAVTSGMTSQQVASALGANGEVGQYAAFSINSHWGYHRKDLWEWLVVNGAE